MIFSPDIQQRYAQERTWQFSDSRMDYELVPEFETLHKQSQDAQSKLTKKIHQFVATFGDVGGEAFGGVHRDDSRDVNIEA
jgi:hypothetical protein